MANLLGKFLNLFRRRTPAADPPPYRDGWGQLRGFLGGHSPGWWASDHLEESRHMTGWTFCAVHAVAKQMANAEVHCYRKLPRPASSASETLTRARVDPAAGGARVKSATTPDGDRAARQPLPETHPLVRLLARPNPYQPPVVFFYILGQQLRLTGSALVWLVNSELGTPAELWAVPTGLAQPQPPTRQYPLGAYWISSVGTTGYAAEWAQSTPWAGGMLVDARTTRRIHWPHPVHLNDGLSPLAACALEVDIAEQLNRATWAAFANEIRPGRVFKVANTGDYVPDQQQLDRFERKIQAWRGGAENAGKHLICPPGVDLANPDRAPAELDYIAGRNQSRDNVLASQQTPPIAAGVTEAGSYSQFYVAMMQWVETSIQPDLSLVAAELSHFLAPYYGDGVCVELLAKRFDDQQMLDARVKTDTAAGILLKNEARALRGLPPLPELDGQFCGDPTPAQKEAAAAPPGAGGGGPPTAMPGLDDDDDDDGGDDDPDDPPLYEPGEADEARSGVGRPDRRGMPRPAMPRLESGVNGHAGG